MKNNKIITKLVYVDSFCPEKFAEINELTLSGEWKIINVCGEPVGVSAGSSYVTKTGALCVVLEKQ